MSEFFLELFSEEIPSGLQKSLREKILYDFKNLFDKRLIKSKKSFSLSSPNRVVIVFEDLDKLISTKSEEIRGPKTEAPEQAIEGFVRSNKIERKNLYRVQTPQMFSANVLRLKDFDKNNEATDESEIIIKKNKKVKIIKGSEKLHKITTEWDYKFLMNIFDTKNNTRIGNGFDVHAFTKEPSKLILGGVTIDYQFGLKGHSDADVLLHSITDAILGSISMGDIGMHFPQNESKWKNANSSIFLKKSLELLKEKNGEINNLDITIICEEPKISKYTKEIQKNLSKLLNIKEETISLKATTTEGLGFTGRKEGIAVMSNILVNIKS
mgnify:CR=1 FL=1